MYVFAAGCPAVEHLAGAEDFAVALATYKAADRVRDASR
jgi:hypothetical protein